MTKLKDLTIFIVSIDEEAIEALKEEFEGIKKISYICISDMNIFNAFKFFF